MNAFWRAVEAIGEGMAAISEGMASMFDLGALQAREKLGNWEDDRRAIARDWEAVGADLRSAMAAFETGLTNEQKVQLARDKSRAGA